VTFEIPWYKCLTRKEEVLDESLVCRHGPNGGRYPGSRSAPGVGAARAISNAVGYSNPGNDNAAFPLSRKAESIAGAALF
jgi:hypothetical protein